MYAHESRIWKNLSAVTGLVILILIVFLVSTASADFATCATDWNNFQNNPGFIADYTNQGQTIRDHESTGSGDPSHGPANVPPASTDLASSADAVTNPGTSTTPFFGYWNGGTVYDPNNPATMEDDYIFFRMRVRGDPADNQTAFSSYHWNILLDVDADGYKEYWIDLEGGCKNKDCPGGVYDRLNILYDNNNQQDIPDPDAPGVRVEYFQAQNAPDGDPSCPGGSPGLSHTKVSAVGDGSGDYYIDIQVPMTAFNDSNGNQVLFPDSPVAFVFSTGASNNDPLQKDHMMDLGFISNADPINFGDIVYPNGQPVIEFTDSSLNFVSFYTIGDNIYVWVTDRLANNDPVTVETISVTVTNTATGDDEVVTLEETGPASGIFTNPSGCGLCSSLTSSSSDGVPNNSDNSGDVEVSSGDTLLVSYTNPNALTVTDEADIVDVCEAYIEFTRANGLPSDSFQLTNDRNTSDKLYVTIHHPDANTDTGSQQTISTVVLTGTSNDQQTMELTFALVETGNDTGEFRNTTGLDTEAQSTFPDPPQEDGLWEDNDAGVVTATYSYTCGGSPYTITATAELFYTQDAGRVFFTNSAGTQDVDLYTPNQDIYVKVEDDSYTCVGPLTVTITPPAGGSGDSEDLVLSETAPGSGVYINSSPSAVTTTTWDGVSTPTADDGVLELSDGDVLTTTYYDCQDGDSDTTNNNKTDTASYNAPELVIDEVLFYPDSTTCQTEYIEILNPSSTQPVNATGYTITDEDIYSYTIPQYQGADLILQPGESVILSIYSSDTPPINADAYQGGVYYLFDNLSPTYPSNEFGGPGDTDPADQISLYDQSSNIVDYVGWSETLSPSVDFLGDDSNAVSEGIWQDDSFKDVSSMSVGYAIQRSPSGYDTNSPSEWVLGSSASTVCDIVLTRAVVSSFNIHEDKNKVVIEWETSSEVGTVGFHLFRLDNRTGKYEKINKKMLPGLVTSPQGGTYRYIDAGSSLNNGNTYLLVEVEASGKEKTYGPYTIEKDGHVVISSQTGTPPTIGRESGLSDETVVYQYVNDEGTIIITDRRSTIKRLNIKRHVQVFYENTPEGSTQIMIAGNTPGSTLQSDDLSTQTIRSAPEQTPGAPSQKAGKDISKSEPDESTYPLESSLYRMKPHAITEEAKTRLDERKLFLQEKRLLRKIRKGAQAKIAVKENGLYHLGSKEIASLLDLSLAKAQRLIQRNGLSLRSRGNDIAYLPTTSGSGIYFYGQGIDSVYTDRNIYWLQRGRGKRMDVVGGTGTRPRVHSETFTEKIHFEQNRFPVTSFDDPESDYWFWDFINSGFSGADSKTLSFYLPGVSHTPGTAVLEIELQGLTDATDGQDHHAVVVLNGSVIGESTWDGKEHHRITLSFDQGLLNEGTNDVAIQGILDPQTPYDLFFIDSFDIRYQKTFKAVNNKLLFQATGNTEVTISGFSDPHIYLFEVSDPGNPGQIKGTTINKINDDYSVRFVPHSDGIYIAASSGAIVPATDMWADEPSRLKRDDNKAEYLIIVPAELKDQAHALAGYRKTRGLISHVVDLEDIMDEFNYGIYSPVAIQQFLTYAYLNWNIPPKYIVLTGNGTFDYKNFLGNDDNVMPAIMKATPNGLFPSDNHFADVDGDTVPEMAIGRLPVLTENELSTVIDKIMSYELSQDLIERKVLLLADDPVDGAHFVSDSNYIASLFPDDYVVEKVYLPDYSANDARQRVSEEINNGTDFINYLGHGGFDRFADVGLLKSGHVSSLTNVSRLPVVTAMTCMVGHYAFPGLDSLSEELIMNNGGGAVAVWSPSGLSINSEAIVLDGLFYKTAHADSKSKGILGNVILKVLKEYSRSTAEPFMIDIYNLIGDPALIIR